MRLSRNQRNGVRPLAAPKHPSVGGSPVAAMSTHPRLPSAALLLALLLAASSLVAQPAPRPADSAQRHQATSLLAPPPLPAAKPPVDLFRDLLAMSPAQRLQFLSNRPPETQKRILAKVHEYELLKPEERLLKLKLTELRWYLVPLLNTPLTNRP